MGMAEQIQKLNMPLQNNYYNKELEDALNYYHTLIRNNIIKPRGNQLAVSNRVMTPIKINEMKIK